MPSAKRKEPVENVQSMRPLYAAAPWTVRHSGAHSEIEAYVEAIGNWATLAQIGDRAGVDAEATADFIVNAVNAYDVNRSLIGELSTALRRCLSWSNLDWDAQHGAEVALRKAEQLIR